MEKTYLETHPWINFQPNLSDAPFTFWMKLGEAQSKCQHIAGVPLRPSVARRLHLIYLSKGIHATTSIEGNTLSEAQVQQAVAGKLVLPKSQEYMALEVQNILDACNEIGDDVIADPTIRISPTLICHFNRLVLRGLTLEEGIESGVPRKMSVGVGGYRGAPWEDCPYLLERLCSWLNDEMVAPNESLKFAYALIKSIIAHLYIAWIHPFGDGNGRTARLVEFLILVQSGVPLPAAHLLSNHYNKTRTRYYAELDRSSKPKVGVIPFLEYAVEGFVDGLAGQLDLIKRQQWKVTWENYVHTRFRDKDTPASKRQRHLILDMPQKPTARNRLTLVSARVARAYADKGDKTLTRDINTLIKLNLLKRAGRLYSPNRELILAFLPRRSDPPTKLSD